MGASGVQAGPSPVRRALVVGPLALVGVGCAGPQGAGTVSPFPLPAGSVLEWQTVNAYNGEARSRVRQQVGAEGSRLVGMDFEDASEAPFGRDRARVVAWQVDARGDLLALERADGSRTRYSPPLPLLPPVLTPGARSRAVVDATDRDGGTPRRVMLATRVGGWETVRVPAGEFRALRIFHDLDEGDGATHRTAMLRQRVDWYAPGPGVVVRREESSLFFDTSSGGGEGSGWLPRAGDWLRWELVAGPGR